MKKRILSLLLALVMVFGLLPVTAQAEDYIYGIEYMVEGDHVVLTGYTGKSAKLVIPAQIEGKPVTVIGYGALQNKYRLTSIVLPDTVTVIGTYAFHNCTSLTDIVIPDSVTSIGEYAFDSCTSLTRIDIPEHVSSIGRYAFWKCPALTEIRVDENNRHFSSDDRGVLFDHDKTVLIEAPGAIAGEYTIPQSVTTIAERAFEQCKALTGIVIPEGVTAIPVALFEDCTSLTHVNIPEHVSSIGVYAFYNCSSLTGIHVDENNQHFSSDDRGVLFDRDKTVLLQAPGAITGDYAVPEGVVSIADRAIYSCTSLTGLDLPESIASIGNYAIYNCYNLTRIRFNGDAPESKYYWFGNADVTAYYPACHAAWTDEAQHHSSGTITWSVYQLPSPHAYTSVVTEPTCTEQGFTTYTCVCGSSYVSDHVPALGHDYKDDTCTLCQRSGALQYQFRGDYVEIVGYKGGLGRITIPAEIEGKPVRRILGAAFSSCDDLLGVYIPDSVTYIESQAFLGCDNLTGIHVDENNQYFSSDERGVLFDRDKTQLIQAPGGIAGAYQIPESVTSIGFRSFFSCNDLTNVDLPQGVTFIGAEAFQFCTGLTSIDIPGGVASIFESTFSSCTHLTSVNLQNGVTYIGNEAFKGCLSLTDIHIPDSVISIGDLAFSTCSKLTGIDLSDGLVSIGHDAFAYCKSLTRVEIPASVTYIGDHPFCECASLTGIHVDENNRYFSSDDRGVLFDRDKTYLIQAPAKLAGSYTIPDSVTSIGVAAFYQCEDVTSIDVPASVISIGGWAFDAGLALRRICFHGDAPEVGKNAIGGYLLTVYYPANNPTWLNKEEQIDIYGNSYWVPYDASHIYENITAFTEPTCTGQGSITYTCACGDSYVIYAEALGHNYAHGICARCGEADPNYQEIPRPSDPANGMLAPDEALNRGMFFYALWNYYGSPEPASTENPFTDVSESDYYYDAVLWAVESGITSGTSATVFGSDITVLRCQAATWLWYAAGSPDSLGLNPYTDVENHQFFYEAALWATTVELCMGPMDPTSFDPYGDCLYGHINWVPANHTHKFSAAVTEPTCTEQGFTLYTCFCDYSYPAKYTDALGHNYVGRTCGRCGEADPDYEGPPFSDVPAGEWFYDSVLWAVENGITNGASADSFDPAGLCLRAHVVTFLHRAAGEPEPAFNGNPFDDVKTSDFFYEPVLWAMEKGITSGISSTEFAPYSVCNRAAVVTFLWRAAGKPEPESTSTSFTDLDPTEFYYKAVLWAVENGITNGIDATHFCPTAPCNRAQVVTFLYRANN